MSKTRLCIVVFPLLLLGSVLALLYALGSGEFENSLWQSMRILLGLEDGGMMRNVLLKLRLPRAIAVFSCGGLLALAGALMQVLLRNPLADPYIFGISGGAAIGALAAIWFGLGTGWMELLALTGASAVTLLVFGLAHGDGAWSQTRLLLTGMVVASGCGAVVMLILPFVPEGKIHSMLFWLTGDASGVTHPWSGVIVLLAGLLCVMPFARELNILAHGEMTARALGVNVRRLRYILYLLASVLTAVSVCLIGTVGFVGLVIPHLVRLVIGNDQRILLPASLLAGGIILTVADTLSRTLVSPLQLPLGALTALIGVPTFLYLLSRQATRAGS